MKDNLLDNYVKQNSNDEIAQIDNRNELLKTSTSSSTNSNKLSIFSDPRKIFYIILLGEIIAILNVSSGEISNRVSGNEKRHFGTILCFIYYLTFGAFWIIFNHGMTKPKFYYFLILFFDTQTNFFKILALSKGDLSYPYIINSSSILFIALLTYIFIKKYRYTWKHFLAIFLCFFGTIISLYGAIKGKDSIMDELDKNFAEFIFSIISAICFAFTIFFMEVYFNKGKEIYNFFPYLGVFGTLMVIIESIIYFKVNHLEIFKNIKVSIVDILYTLLFMIISVILGTVIPFYIKRYSASMYNFFMVSQIFWSYIFNIIFQNNKAVNFLFYIGFIIILGSTILFSIFKLKEKKNETKKDSISQSINLISPSERVTQL